MSRGQGRCIGLTALVGLAVLLSFLTAVESTFAQDLSAGLNRAEETAAAAEAEVEHYEAEISPAQKGYAKATHSTTTSSSA